MAMPSVELSVATAVMQTVYVSPAFRFSMIKDVSKWMYVLLVDVALLSFLSESQWTLKKDLFPEGSSQCRDTDDVVISDFVRSLITSGSVNRKERNNWLMVGFHTKSNRNNGEFVNIFHSSSYGVKMDA